MVVVVVVSSLPELQYIVSFLVCLCLLGTACPRAFGASETDVGFAGQIRSCHADPVETYRYLQQSWVLPFPRQSRERAG